MSFKLLEIESQSALWQKLSAELTKRLDLLRQKNDGNHDPMETAKIRGQIAEVKTMLDWAKPNPAIISSD